jgi:hypothetical protein
VFAPNIYPLSRDPADVPLITPEASHCKAVWTFGAFQGRNRLLGPGRSCSQVQKSTCHPAATRLYCTGHDRNLAGQTEEYPDANCCCLRVLDYSDKALHRPMPWRREAPRIDLALAYPGRFLVKVSLGAPSMSRIAWAVQTANMVPPACGDMSHSRAPPRGTQVRRTCSPFLQVYPRTTDQPGVELSLLPS